VVHATQEEEEEVVPQYLSKLCWTVAIIPGHHNLCSAHHGQPDVPSYRLTTYGGRSFVCAAAAAWNSLPNSLKDTALSLPYVQNHLQEFSLLSILTIHSLHYSSEDRCHSITIYTLLTYLIPTEFPLDKAVRVCTRIRVCRVFPCINVTPFSHHTVAAMVWSNYGLFYVTRIFHVFKPREVVRADNRLYGPRDRKLNQP